MNEKSVGVLNFMETLLKSAEIFSYKIIFFYLNKLSADFWQIIITRNDGSNDNGG